jgi:hypothetical protein
MRRFVGGGRYRGSADHFRHLIACHRPRPQAEAYLRLRCLPGEQAQVDWGHFGHLEIGRARRPLMAFVMVLTRRWDWRNRTSCLCARRTNRSRARRSSLASVGKATAFGCTVVSTMTRVKSAGFAAPVRVARDKLYCSSAVSFSSPTRWRQRVIDERSNGSV